MNFSIGASCEKLSRRSYCVKVYRVHEFHEQGWYRDDSSLLYIRTGGRFYVCDTAKRRGFSLRGLQYVKKKIMIKER